MSAQTLVFGRVLGDAAVAALVGVKVFWLRAPQKTNAPYITFQVVSNRGVGSLSGNTSLSSGLWQFDCYANDPSAARAIADAVIAALDGWKGYEDSGHVAVRLDESRDLDDDEVGLARVSLDFRIWDNKEE